MSSRTPTSAARNLVQQTQRAISCISDSVILLSKFHRSQDQVFKLTLGNGGFYSLPGDERLSLSGILFCRVIPDPDEPRAWKMVVVGYAYAFANARLEEILAYHWHPDQRSHVKHPHIHLGAGAQVGFDALSNAHIPSGWIALPDVIRMAITELKVTPRRDDREVILDGAREVHNRFAG